MPALPPNPKTEAPLSLDAQKHTEAVIRSNALDGRTSGAGSPFIAITSPYLLIHKPLIEHLPYTVEREKRRGFFFSRGANILGF